MNLNDFIIAGGHARKCVGCQHPTAGQTAVFGITFEFYLCSRCLVFVMEIEALRLKDPEICLFDPEVIHRCERCAADPVPAFLTDYEGSYMCIACFEFGA